MAGTWRMLPHAVDAFVEVATEGGLSATSARAAAMAARVHPEITAAAGSALWQRPILAAMSRFGDLGLALGDDIFLSNPSVLTRWSVLAHELVHVMQYQRRGVAPFLVGYASEYLWHRLRGHDGRAAYYRLEDEVEAFAIERLANRQKLAQPFVVVDRSA